MTSFGLVVILFAVVHGAYFSLCFDICPFLTYTDWFVSIGQVRGELPRRPWAQVFDVQSAEGQHAMEVR